MTPSAPLSVRWLRMALAAAAFVVVVEATLGLAGATAAAAPVVGLAVVAAAAGALARARREKLAAGALGGRPAWTAADGVAVLALGVALLTRLWEGLHHADASFTYDVLSYHLHLPASWRAAGRVGIVPTPFGDQAPAYAPANAELIYLLALSATGNLRLAHAGQAPFAALAALAIVATARQLGASRRLACGAALAFLMVPEIWQQATGAMADLALASFFLACLPFLLRLRDRRGGADVAALGAGLGLVMGTKYAGAAFAVPLLAWALWLLARGARQGEQASPRELSRARTAGVLAVLGFACGGFWYARNLALTGDPLFPVTLSLGGLTLAPGLYGGAEMRRWTYHLPVTNIKPLLEMFGEAGWGFLSSLAGGLLVGTARGQARVTGLFGVLIAIGWLALPYQQSRFLFAAWGVGAVAMAAAAATIGSARVRALALAPAVVGGAVQFPTTARLVAAGLWSMAALLEPSEDVAATTATPALVWLGPAAFATLALAVATWTRLRPDDRLARLGDPHDEGWAYVRAHVQGSRIAYTGSNLTLPLWGWRMENRVRYVNIAGKGPVVLHDFRDGAPVADTAEPAPERARPDRQAWLGNLTAEQIDLLFVARLYPEVASSMPHDQDGFPVERGWADALPARFRPVFATPDIRIYDVGEAGATGAALERHP